MMPVTRRRNRVDVVQQAEEEEPEHEDEREDEGSPNGRLLILQVHEPGTDEADLESSHHETDEDVDSVVFYANPPEDRLEDPYVRKVEVRQRDGDDSE